MDAAVHIEINKNPDELTQLLHHSYKQKSTGVTLKRRHNIRFIYNFNINLYKVKFEKQISE